MRNKSKNSRTEQAERIRHPGLTLQQDYLLPRGLSGHGLALTIGVAPSRVNAILSGQRAITADTALRLAKLFGTEPSFWLYAQADFDLQEARQNFEDAKQHTINEDVDSKKAVKLNGRKKEVYELLSDHPIQMDKLCQMTNMQIGELAATLTMLELDGLVRRHPGDWYTKV